MDTSIIEIIRNTAIVQHIESSDIYLVNNSTGYVLAEYKDGEWNSWNTTHVTLDISYNDLTSNESEKWRFIA